MDKNKNTSLIALALTLTLAPPSLAQGSGQRAALEEVLVTARKRAENLQETPIAITAVTAPHSRAMHYVSRVLPIRKSSPRVCLVCRLTHHTPIRFIFAVLVNAQAVLVSIQPSVFT